MDVGALCAQGLLFEVGDRLLVDVLRAWVPAIVNRCDGDLGYFRARRGDLDGEYSEVVVDRGARRAPRRRRRRRGVVVVAGGAVVVVLRAVGVVADSEPSERLTGVELKLMTPARPIRVPVMTSGARFMMSVLGRVSYK